MLTQNENKSSKYGPVLLVLVLLLSLPVPGLAADELQCATTANASVASNEAVPIGVFDDEANLTQAHFEALHTALFAAYPVEGARAAEFGEQDGIADVLRFCASGAVAVSTVDDNGDGVRLASKQAASANCSRCTRAAPVLVLTGVGCRSSLAPSSGDTCRCWCSRS